MTTKDLAQALGISDNTFMQGRAFAKICLSKSFCGRSKTENFRIGEAFSRYITYAESVI